MLGRIDPSGWQKGKQCRAFFFLFVDERIPLNVLSASWGTPCDSLSRKNAHGFREMHVIKFSSASSLAEGIAGQFSAHCPCAFLGVSRVSRIHEVHSRAVGMQHHNIATHQSKV